MALLGIQLAITMLMASLLQKLAPHISLARWTLCHRLVRYLHPSDEELRSLAGVASSGKGKSKSNKDRKAPKDNNDNSFMVPRSIEIELESAQVQPIDVMQLHYYPEFQWLIDFSICSALVYTVTELYNGYFPHKDEVNLSLMWCVLVLAFSLKVLFSVTALYFRGDEAKGERAMCVTSGFFFLVLAMAILVVDENVLEFGLEKAHANFSKNFANFMQSVGAETRNPTSRLGLRFVLAVWCGFIGAFFTFPGLRLAKMHVDTLRFCSESPFLRLILHLSFISPLLISLLWVKPIARDYFTVRMWPGMTSTLMTPDAFETSRLVAIVIVAVLRLYLMPYYLQSYLNMAHDRIAEMKKEAGRISSIELQRKVARVFYYLCVVALQYVAPLLMCLYFSLLLKTLGNYSWSSYFSDICTDPEMEESVTVSFPKLNETENVLENSQSWALTLASLKQMFTPVLYRGVLGFMTWWVCSVWFATSAIGLIYHSYFVQ